MFASRPASQACANPQGTNVWKEAIRPAHSLCSLHGSNRKRARSLRQPVPRCRPSRAVCKQHKEHQLSQHTVVNIEFSRRLLLVSGAVTPFLGTLRQARGFEPPPQGYKLLRDRLDGYSFFLPESWTPLSSSGNEVFYRNPFNVNENLFVNISSPSSSKYSSVDDLKSPGKAAERTRQQYLRELLSTRIGVKRTADVVSASDREASDGRKYYDLELEARSYASRNQLAVSQREIDAGTELEWDRRYITVLGVANKRLYEFRLQTARDTYEKAKDTLFYIAQSFRCFDVDN